MTHSSDNFTCKFVSRSGLNSLLKFILSHGDVVNGTFELTNTRITLDSIPPFDMDYWNKMGARTHEVTELLKAIEEGDPNITSSLYDSKYYLMAKEESKKATERFDIDGKFTRQALISFPPLHCFETIQFMVRKNMLIITVNMRSCNAYKNLMSDLCLAFCLAIKSAAPVLGNISLYKMVVNVGSLHVYEEDVKNVL